MKRKIRFLTLVTLLALVLVPTSAVFAQGPSPDGGKVVFGDNFTLESGQTFDGDLVVFGGNVTIEEDAELNGNLVVFGGTADSNGTVNGDIVIIGGQVKLGEEAVVSGDVVTVGGQLERAEGAEIEGEVINNVQPEIDIPGGRVPPVVIPPDIPNPVVQVGFGPFWEIFGIFFWAAVASAFAMLLSLFLQPQIERAGHAMVSQPVMMSAIGLLAVAAGLILLITVIPLIVVFCAGLFGVVALGLEVGERFTKAINQVWPAVLKTGFGTFLVMVVGGTIGMIPCLGGIVLALPALLVIGGTISTWFGIRPIQSAAMSVYIPPADSGQVPPASSS